MASRVTETGDLAGILLADDKLTLWDAETTAQEASPVSQRATAGRSTPMAIIGSGVPDNGDTIELFAARGGAPTEDSAAYLWRVTSGEYYGWEAPNAVERLRLLQPLGAQDLWESPHAVAVGDGTIVAAVEDFDGVTRKRDLKVSIRSSVGVWSATSTIYTLTNFFAYGLPLYPRLVHLSDGSIELYHAVYEIKDPGATPPFDFWLQVRKWRSTDGGSTWELSQLACLQNRVLIPSGQTVSDMTVAYGNGQHLLCFTLEPAGNLYTYASRDGGNLFQRVGVQTAQTYQVDAAYHNGFFTVAIGPKRFAGAGPWPTTPLVGRTGDPFREITDWDYATDQAATSTAGDYLAGLALVPSEIGLLLLWGNAPYGVEHYLLRSLDGGASWSAYYDVANDADRAAIWWRSTGPLDANYASATGIGPTGYCGVWHRGALLMLGSAIIGNADPSLGTELRDLLEWQLGGYSTHTRPLGAGGQGLTSSLYTVNWTAWDQPHIASVFNTNHTGVPGIAFSADLGMNVTTAVGVFGQWVHGITTPSGRTTQIATAIVACNTGAARIALSGLSGGTQYMVSALLTPASISLYDEAAAAALQTAVTTVSTKYEIRLGVDWSQPSAALWYREYTVDGEARDWTYLGAGTPTALGFGFNPSAFIEVGSSTLACDSDWYYLAINSELESTLLTTSGTVQEVTPAGWGDAQTAAELSARDFSSSPVYVHDGVSIRCVGGLCRGQDTWSLAPSAAYKVEHVQPLDHPSPRRTWRSIDDTSGKYIAWQWDPNSEGRDAQSQVITLHLENINFGEVEISRKAGGSWGTAVTASLWKLDGVSFDRYGDTLVPNSATTDTTYLQENELAGGFVKFSNGSLRRIKSNTAGVWYASATERRASIRLESTDGAEPTTTPSTIQVAATRATVYLHPRGQYVAEGIRIEPTEAGPDGYFEIGSAVLGGALVFGDRPDSTRTRVLEVSEQITESPDGTRRSFRDQPNRARWEVSWVQRSMRALGQSDAPADGLPYVQASEDASALPAATVHSTPLDVYGAVSLHGRAPVVLLPKIPQDTGGATGLYVRAGWDAGLYGRVASQTVRLETADGLADTCGERVRLAVLTVEQET